MPKQSKLNNQILALEIMLAAVKNGTAASLTEYNLEMVRAAIDDLRRVSESRSLGGKKGAKGSPRPTAGRPRKPDSELSASARSKRKARAVEKLEK